MIGVWESFTLSFLNILSISPWALTQWILIVRSYLNASSAYLMNFSICSFLFSFEWAKSSPISPTSKRSSSFKYYSSNSKLSFGERYQGWTPIQGMIIGDFNKISGNFSIIVCLHTMYFTPESSLSFNIYWISSALKSWRWVWESHNYNFCWSINKLILFLKKHLIINYFKLIWFNHFLKSSKHLPQRKPIIQPRIAVFKYSMAIS